MIVELLVTLDQVEEDANLCKLEQDLQAMLAEKFKYNDVTVSVESAV